MISRPKTPEYDPYYQGYIDLADVDPLGQLRNQISAFQHLAEIAEEAAGHRPAPAEWSAKEVLVHLCDFERMFVYRALRFSRGDTSPIAGFEQDAFIATAEADARTVREIVEEFVALRRSTIGFFTSLSPTQLGRSGIAGGAEVTVRALVFIVAGHCEGHLNDLRRLNPELF